MELKDITCKTKMLNYTVGKLLKQNCKSQDFDNARCAYRGMGDDKCAAGQLIADEHHSIRMEGLRASCDRVFNAIGKSLPNYKLGRKKDENGNEEDRRLVDALQGVHDTYEVKEWEVRFKEVAERFNIRYNPVKF